MDVFVARQPIFDRDKNVHGYELLFRSGFENYYDSLDANKATVDVISNSFFVIGFDDLTDGKRAFINFTRGLLVKGVASLLPKDAVTVELLEDIEPDAEAVDMCRKLKQSGFTVAMDDFVFSTQHSPLLPYVDIVKVDFMATDPEQRETICRHLADKGVTMLAEKVETVQEFDEALAMGYSFFQGYFFSKPVIKTGKHIAGNKLTYLQMLREVNQPGVSYDQLEALIKQDISLTYKLLRFINSAWFGFRCEIRSIRHALILMGPKEIKKWFALIGLQNMASDKPQELIYRAVARGKIAEGMAPLVGMQERSSELFLMGMFSLIDALIDSPMADIMAKLPLDNDVKKALMGEDLRLKPVYDMILAYEKGDWVNFSQHADRLNIDENLMPDLYTDSLKWTHESFTTV